VAHLNEIISCVSVLSFDYSKLDIYTLRLQLIIQVNAILLN